MTFTQFKFPNGSKSRVMIDIDSEIEGLARQLDDAGWSFEIEIHPDTQIVHMDCCDEDRAISNRVCRNGPQVPIKVAELVKEAFEFWISENKPKAVGNRNNWIEYPELFP